MVFEDIVHPDGVYMLAAALILVVSGFVIGLYLTIRKQNISGIIIFTSIVIIAISILWVHTNTIDQWEDQILEQVNSLDCEDFEEAYKTYEREYIKETYIEKCTEIKKKSWYLD